MQRTVSLKLLTTAEQASALSSLADVFANACNAVVPFSRKHRYWNRVALHHLAYYPVREQFSSLGSQMVCQAIHRLADACKVLKANHGLAKDKPIPTITFRPTSVNLGSSQNSENKAR